MKEQQENQISLDPAGAFMSFNKVEPPPIFPDQYRGDFPCLSMKIGEYL